MIDASPMISACRQLAKEMGLSECTSGVCRRNGCQAAPSQRQKDDLRRRLGHLLDDGDGA